MVEVGIKKNYMDSVFQLNKNTDGSGSYLYVNVNVLPEIPYISTIGVKITPSDWKLKFIVTNIIY